MDELVEMSGSYRAAVSGSSSMGVEAEERILVLSGSAVALCASEQGIEYEIVYRDMNKKLSLAFVG